MLYFTRSLFLLIIFYSQLTSATIVRGINYDPVHSPGFASGMATENKAHMVAAIKMDLDKLKTIEIQKGIHITHLKTFFSVFMSNKGTVVLPIADVVNEWNKENPDFKKTLTVGVREFTPKDGCETNENCQTWTDTQIKGAIDSAIRYKQYNAPLIDKIIVGNENVQQIGAADRLANDIAAVKNKLKKAGVNSVLVGTAQTFDGTKAILEGQYPQVLSVLDFLGANVYPFWSGVNYSEMKTTYKKMWDTLKHTKYFKTLPVIATEEGWPTAGNNGSAKGSSKFARDYFQYWYDGHDSPSAHHDDVVSVSYYFSLNDKLPGQGVESHWGIVSADDSSDIFSTKDKTLANNIVFPHFENDVGIPDSHHEKPVIILVCADADAKGICGPLYGYDGSGVVPAAWGQWPSVNSDLMVDNSLMYYQSLLIILDDGMNYPAVCKVPDNLLKTINNKTTIGMYWPVDDQVVNCVINA